MDASPPRFVVTAWRNSRELLQLRQDIYSSDPARRQTAVHKVFAWRLRKPDGLPLLLDSTADLVHVVLQDEREDLNPNALRLLYATALSRFVTGLADTQTELTRDRPAWFPPGKSLQLPYQLLEIRHRIVHRHLPSLAELKRAAKDSLDWLWEWYWNQLDHAFPLASDSRTDLEPDVLVRERLQGILKAYVKERKTEIKSRMKDPKAVETALTSYTLHYGTTSTPPASTAQARRILLQLLIDERMILPADKKLGSTMSGAFLIWDDFFLVFCQNIFSIRALLQQVLAIINDPLTSPTLVDPTADPTKEGLYEWTLHLLGGNFWSASDDHSKFLEDILAELFSNPSGWNARIARTILKKDDVPNEEQWRAVLSAASSVEDDDDLEAMEEEEEAVEKERDLRPKIRGPTKVIGLWKPRPLGWLPEGWEEDE